MTRIKIINTIIKSNKYKSYLEIGVNTPAQPGYSHDSIQIELKHGVDPAVDTTYKMTSDEFFATHINMKYDIVFIDGLHIFEQAYRDIINSLKNLNDNGTIVVHDCNPTKEITQRRERASNVWHGDVWKAILKLRIENPNVEIYTVDADEGCVVIKKGSQKLLSVDKSQDIYNYKYFNKNRKSILNLVSVNEFITKINSSVIVKLQGGLGNQLFQYALGRNLSITNNIKVKYDRTWFKNQDFRNYELDIFNVQENIAIESEIETLTKYKPLTGKLSFLNIFRKTENSIYLKEKQFNYDKEVLTITHPAYLDGYWQSEKYFSNIKDYIVKEFSLRNPSVIENNPLKLEITKSNSVSIHIRKTDYLNNSKNPFYHDCPLSYYYNAIKIIEESNNDIKLFIFSDDIKWAKENFKTNHPHFFAEGNKSYEDLIFMSLCKHNIIANSSFSWWGAWLNRNLEKIVITPKKWFTNPEINTDDLIPEGWIKI